jgi:uncharacterized protein
MDLDRLLTVFLFAGLVYALAVGDLVTTVLQWRRRRRGDPFVDGNGSEHRWERRIRRLASVLAVVGLLCIGWAFYEPYDPEVTRVELESPKLTAAIRVVQISDLHSDPEVRLEQRLPGIIRELRPDLVVFTGDAINSMGGLANFRSCMRQIADLCPAFGVRGNWEVWWFPEVDVFAGTGVRELAGEPVPVRVRGQEIWISGVAVDHEELADEMLARVPRDRFSLFVHHYPSLWSTGLRGGADLHLAGDTHGGQAVLPGLGALVRITRGDGKYYEAGLHRQRAASLYVNRGIGMEGGAVPRVRFNCRPEITLFELRPGK